MRIVIWVIILNLGFGCGHSEKVITSKTKTDESESSESRSVGNEYGSYQEALKEWKSPNDISQWIGSNFRYDMQRALALSETRKEKGKKINFTSFRIISY